MKSLEGVESHQEAEEHAMDRVSLMKTLRFRNSRNKLEKTEPPYVLLFSKLLGDWPTITKGGCRYLIPARIKCIKQLRLLARANIKWHKEGLTNLVSEETITRMRNEVRMEREKARVLQDESAKARADADQLQSEEEHLGALADELGNEVMSWEWQVPTLEKGCR